MAGHADYCSDMTRRRTMVALAAALVGVDLTSIGRTSSQDLTGFAASLLAQLITASRQQVLGAGTTPMPVRIMQGLSGYFPPELLRAVRYRSGGRTELSLSGLAFQYGDAVAVTLIDVVMFRDEAAAQQDLKLWAHELTHVMQYRRLGVDGFAARYVADSGAVEREAYANADRFVAWRGSVRR